MTAYAPTKQRTFQEQEYRLAGHIVTQSMHMDARRAKAAGKRVIFVSAGEAEALRGLSDEDCENCGGFGQFALEVIMAGPFRNAPPGYRGVPDGEKEGVAEKLHTYPAWHNDAWWSVVRTTYPCPVCSNTREIIL